jgi:hypothetical protein
MVLDGVAWRICGRGWWQRLRMEEGGTMDRMGSARGKGSFESTKFQFLSPTSCMHLIDSVSRGSKGLVDIPRFFTEEQSYRNTATIFPEAHIPRIRLQVLYPFTSNTYHQQYPNPSPEQRLPQSTSRLRLQTSSPLPLNHQSQSSKWVSQEPCPRTAINRTSPRRGTWLPLSTLDISTIPLALTMVIEAPSKVP